VAGEARENAARPVEPARSVRLLHRAAPAAQPFPRDEPEPGHEWVAQKRPKAPYRPGGSDRDAGRGNERVTSGSHRPGTERLLDTVRFALSQHTNPGARRCGRFSTPRLLSRRRGGGATRSGGALRLARCAARSTYFRSTHAPPETDGPLGSLYPFGMRGRKRRTPVTTVRSKVYSRSRAPCTRTGPGGCFV